MTAVLVVEVVGEVEVVVVVVDEVVVVYVMPRHISRASLLFNPQPNTRSLSACVSDMLYNGEPAKGRDIRGGI